MMIPCTTFETVVLLNMMANILSGVSVKVAYNGLELSCPAEAGNPSPLYVTPAGQASISFGPAGRPSKHQLRPRPPGQLQRVVGLPTNGRLLQQQGDESVGTYALRLANH
jgi:hypothetical protein